MKGNRVDVESTCEFVKEHIARGDRVLEVGAGDGRVARALMREKLAVHAIDSSAAAVQRMLDLGIDAVNADFLSFESDPFDIILFSRSLHHIVPLDSVPDRASQLLRPQGKILIEDFDVRSPDEQTAHWFFGLRATLAAIDIGSAPDASLPADPLDAWRAEHHGRHAIAGRCEMTESLRTRFRLVSAQRCEYLYRYFREDCSDQDLAGRLAAAIFAWESGLIKHGAIQPVGWRSVWQRSDAGYM